MPSGVITSLLIDATGQAEEVLQVVHTGAFTQVSQRAEKDDMQPLSKSLNSMKTYFLGLKSFNHFRTSPGDDYIYLTIRREPTHQFQRLTRMSYDHSLKATHPMICLHLVPRDINNNNLLI